VLQIAVMMFVTPFILIIFVALAAQKFFYRGVPWAQIVEKPLLALLTELVVYVAVAAYMFSLVEDRYDRRFLDAISWNWPKGGWLKFAGLGVLLLAGLEGFAHLLPIPKNVPFDQFFKHPFEAYLTSLFAISLGPLMEELFFRGFLYPVLARRMGVVKAVILTAVGFGLIHALQLGFAWGLVLIIFLVGVVLTIVRAVTRSVASGFVVHVAYNLTLTLMGFISSDGFRHLEKLSQ
jgi:uncharacterized protein